jgi:hypothetical protein
MKHLSTELRVGAQYRVDLFGYGAGADITRTFVRRLTSMDGSIRNLAFVSEEQGEEAIPARLWDEAAEAGRVSRR